MDEITESAVKGYCYESCKRAGLSKEQIEAVMEQLRFALDSIEPEAAERIYKCCPFI